MDRIRRGITLLEIVVSFTVISVLLSLALYGASLAREAARRTMCVNRQRNIGVATAQFESTHHVFPPPSNRVTSGPLKNVESDSDWSTPPHSSGWGYLLSFLGEQRAGRQSLESPTLSHITGNPGMGFESLFMCPSEIQDSGVNYRFSAGASPYCYRSKEQENKGAFVFFHTVGSHEIESGLSNVVGFSERRIGVDYTSSIGDTDLLANALNIRLNLIGELIFTADSLERLSRSLADSPDLPILPSSGAHWYLLGLHHTMFNHVLTPNAKTPSIVSFRANSTVSIGIGAVSASSFHPGGVVCSRMDGSTSFVSGSIDVGVWRALGTISGSVSSL